MIFYTGGFYQTFEQELTLILHSLFHKKGEKTLSNTFYEASITPIPKPDKDIITEENYRPIYLMSIDSKFLSEILANKIQQHKGKYILLSIGIYPRNARLVLQLKNQLIELILIEWRKT